jgi:hypothetical protein
MIGDAYNRRGIETSGQAGTNGYIGPKPEPNRIREESTEFIRRSFHIALE